MSVISVTQSEMLVEYNQMLNVLSEGFDYLENNLEDEAPPQVQQVFVDTLNAFDQLSKIHNQMEQLLEEDGLEPLLADFSDIIRSLAKWFDQPTNDEKRDLLIKEVSPSFKSWKQRMQALIHPYVAH
ncbi:hypothetical protein [Thalassobacillus hwangdonensis]|uniref:DUF8042 domain-containing protein n=1 Tax=Thalassobacillus hwangdonensis TaxID=546108 RepID=A0ABW3L3F8_9BACI